MTDARDAWLADATTWITASLGDDVVVTSLRERFWGAILRAEMPDRTFFFKAVGDGGKHEPVIVADIAAIEPRLVPEVIAADVDRGWLLMADHGTPMFESIDNPGEAAIWEEILPEYAEMQRLSVAKIDRWIEAGTPDRRLHVLPALIERLLMDGSVPLDPDLRRAIASTLPELERRCDELASAPFAHGIDHSDMHGANVLVGRGEPRLVDWGDSCITHPFTSVFVPYQFTVAKLPEGDRTAAARRLRDVYLEAWGEPRDLREHFATATWLGHLVRALNFEHQLEPDEWRAPVAKFLTRWYEQRTLLDHDDDLVIAIANQTE
jgi:hypothetical protein